MTNSPAFYHKKQFWYWVLFLAAFIGFAVSGYLHYEYLQPTAIGCSVIAGCEDVRNSEYSVLAGISVPVWGLAFYFLLTIYSISVFLPRRVHDFERYVLFLYTLGGFGMSAYFTYIELFVIHAICQWCVVSAITATVAFLASVVVGRGKLVR